MNTTPKILIVDDNRDVLNSLRRTLRRTGFDLVCVDQPQEAIEHMRNDSFDVLLSDIDMPNINGHEVMREAKILQPTMVRVFVTGAGSIDAAVRAINEGEVHRFVRKPFDAGKLRELVQEALVRKEELELAAEASTKARRRKQLCDQLELEHPGITEFSLEGGVYIVPTEDISQTATEIGLRLFVEM